MLKPKEGKPEKEIKIRVDVLTSIEDKPEVSHEFKPRRVYIRGGVELER